MTERAVVIVESCFGSTAAVARALADRLRAAGVEVELTEAATAPSRVAADLVLVGAPTHNLGLPTAGSRAQAASKGAGPAVPGVREWIAGVERVDGRVLSFGTRTAGRFSGSAGKAIAKALARRGVDAVRGEDFVVTGLAGPLADGELDRAGQWAAGLVR